MAVLCSSIMWALPGFVSGARSSFLICLSLIGLVIPVSCPRFFGRHGILWSSWGPMTTIEDEEFFFFG